MQQTFILPPTASGQRLDVALAALLPEHSRSRITDWIRQERVRVNGASWKPKDKVQGGEELVVELDPPEIYVDAAEAMDLTVIYEDAFILVLNKVAGCVVHPGAGNRQGTLLNGILHHAPECAVLPRAGIVHRLDKDTSGLLVIAKTLEAQTSLVRQLQARTVHRVYHALVLGDLPGSGTFEGPIGRHPNDRVRMAVLERDDPRGKEAKTHYRALKRWGGVCTLLECRLETGRTHQIRVHCAHRGHPLVGDAIYNPRHHRPRCEPEVRTVLDAFKRQALHAEQLSFTHPQTECPVSFMAPIPVDFQQLLAQLSAFLPG